MRFISAPLQGVFIIEPDPFCDGRGMFNRIFCTKELEAAGLCGHISQVNRSVTRLQGAIRGMHYQRPPLAEVKIVSCLRGRVFDVVIDLRASSPTKFKWFSTELAGDNVRSLYVPEGFAHGFQVLMPDSEMLYFHSKAYSSPHESGVRWDDPMVSIQWPLEPMDLSERDRGHALLSYSFEGVVVNSDALNRAWKEERE